MEPGPDSTEQAAAAQQKEPGTDIGAPAGVAGQADAAATGAGQPEPELLVIPARQVGGPPGQVGG